MTRGPDGATIDSMSRLLALAVLLALVGAPVTALDREDLGKAMPCCEGDPCGQAIGQAPQCCELAPAAPAERPALKVERAAPSLPLVSSVLPTLPSLAGLRRAAAVSATPLDTSPSRPVVLRL